MLYIKNTARNKVCCWRYSKFFTYYIFSYVFHIPTSSFRSFRSPCDHLIKLSKNIICGATKMIKQIYLQTRFYTGFFSKINIRLNIINKQKYTYLIKLCNSSQNTHKKEIHETITKATQIPL